MFLVEWNNELELSYGIIADDVFPLTMQCMKHYSSQNLSDRKWIFGYRLSKSRWTTESVFRSLSHRFQVLSFHMYLQLNKSIKIILSCCLLHHILHTHSNNSYIWKGFADEAEANGAIRSGEWRDRSNSAMQLLPATTSRHTSHGVEKIRDNFWEYFYGRGQVSYQWKRQNWTVEGNLKCY